FFSDWRALVSGEKPQRFDRPTPITRHGASSWSGSRGTRPCSCPRKTAAPEILELFLRDGLPWQRMGDPLHNPGRADGRRGTIAGTSATVHRSHALRWNLAAVPAQACGPD